MKPSEQMKQRDPFLSNPDALHYMIKCVGCREDLWETQVLKRSGNVVMSSQTNPVEEVVPPFSDQLETCPYCLERFYGVGKGGSQMYLIRDLNCDITRLI